jgi:large subunit ribosomal protein L29
MKNADIKGLSMDDLQEKLYELEEKLLKLKLNHAVSEIENPMQIRSTRRLIARVKTEIRKRELAEN